MNLYDYQKQAINFILKERKCALFLDMGLGKTVITLTAIDFFLKLNTVNRVLIIAPLRVANTVWKQEAEKWEHLRHLHIEICTGSPKKREKAINADAHITVINKENIIWITSKQSWKWDMVVIDESSAFKSHNSNRFKSLKRFIGLLKSIVLLTGTPSPKSYQDLWSQMYLIDGGQRLLPYISHFLNEYFICLDRDYQKWEIKKTGVAQIKAKIKDKCLTMKSEDYLQLPKRINLYQRLNFDKKTTDMYKEMKKEYLVELESGEYISAPSASRLVMKLLQICNGAVYDDQKKVHHIHDIKINALKELVEENPSENILVAYNFVHDLSRLQKAFPYAQVLDKSGKVLEAWNRGEIKMLLAHPASAGHGLNMQAGGSMLVWFSLMWNLEYYQQFNARLHRQGQTKPVRIVHLMMKKSVDESILTVLKKRNATQNDLMAFLKKNINEF